ncbi:hypothetical protein [Aeromicrobium massiliense]|uniref:hypothetical protein n=1 Tax=Aeromicrobium massiliense TaxID=1464554 RepID=UPI0011CAF236|nr:hypothetical protein [Aeromicrobium massiliense]
MPADDSGDTSVLVALEERARALAWAARRDSVELVVDRDGRTLTVALAHDVDQLTAGEPGARIWVTNQHRLAGRGPVLVVEFSTTGTPVVVDGIRSLAVSWCPGRVCASVPSAGMKVPQACPGHVDWRLDGGHPLADVWSGLLTGALIEHTVVPVAPLMPATFFVTAADQRAAELHEREAAGVRATNQRRVTDVAARAAHATAATAHRRETAAQVAKHYAHSFGAQLYVGAELPELAHGVALTDEADVLVALVEPDAHRLHRAAASRLGTMTVWMATDQGAADIKNRTRRADVWSLRASALRAGCSCG